MDLGQMYVSDFEVVINWIEVLGSLVALLNKNGKYFVK